MRRQRLLAWLVDWLLVLGLWKLLGGLGWLAIIAYWLLRDGLFQGQSIGKRLMGLKVVTHTTHLPCTFKESAIRNVLWVVPVINFFMACGTLFYFLRDGGARHWGDRLADTQVVRDVAVARERSDR